MPLPKTNVSVKYQFPKNWCPVQLLMPYSSCITCMLVNSVESYISGKFHMTSVFLPSNNRTISIYICWRSSSLEPK